MDNKLNKELSSLIMIISKNLILERNKCKLTQEQLAYSSDVTVSTISKIERGDVENISLKTLVKLCNSLDLTFIALIQIS